MYRGEIFNMENTLYFKDMRTKDSNDYPSKIYKIEHSRIFIEVLDRDHIHGKPHYIKEHILRINSKELLQIQSYWAANN